MYTPWHRQPLDAGFLHEIQERRRAAVHDRHFVAIELDDDVVDADADQGRQQVFDSLDGRAVPSQDRGVVKRGNLRDCGRNLDSQIRAPEDNSGISERRFQGQRHLVAGVKSDSSAGDLTA